MDLRRMEAARAARAWARSRSSSLGRKVGDWKVEAIGTLELRAHLRLLPPSLDSICRVTLVEKVEIFEGRESRSVAGAERGGCFNLFSSFSRSSVC